MAHVPEGFKILAVEHDYDCVGCQVLVGVCVDDFDGEGVGTTQIIWDVVDFAGVTHQASVFREPVPAAGRVG